jgi:hypothetical protein
VRGTPLLLIALAGCDTVFGLDGSADAGASAVYSHRSTITVHPPSDDVLADFPLGVVVPAGDVATSIAAETTTGREIQFSLEDGTVLDAELEQIGQPDGRVVAWVRVPMLAKPTTLYMLYGRGPELARRNASVWRDYGAVWHFENDDVGTARDSLGDHDASVTANAPPAVSDGVAGPARRYTNGEGLHVIDHGASDAALQANTADLTFELWLRTYSLVGEADMPLWKGGSSGSQGGYDFELGLHYWLACASDGASASAICAGIPAERVPALGSWRHLAGVIDGARLLLTFYIDGGEQDNQSLTGLPIYSGEAMDLGRADFPMDADLDEVRISHVARSSAWLRAETLNLTDPAFLTLGSPEPL